MRICIIRSNPVNPDSRVEKEVSALCSAGHKVHVLAWDRDDSYKRRTEYLTVQNCRAVITRIGFKASFGEGFKNIVPFAGFQILMFRHLFQNRDRYDVIHACDFDTAFLSQIAAKILHKKFIFDIFDFIYGEPQNWFQKFIKKAEIRIISQSDAVIICSEERKKQIKDAHPKKLAVIHNTPMETGKKAFETTGDRHPVRAVYVGILQDYRLLKEMLSFYKKHSEYEWHVGGFGKYEQEFIDASQKYKNIIFYGKISYEQTLSLESQCDIITAVYDPRIENHRFAAPNKFYEGLMLGKPLIMVKGTGMSEIVKKYDIGELIDYSEKGFREGILKLVHRKMDWKEMSKKMQNLYHEKYSWEVMADRLCRLYRDINV